MDRNQGMKDFIKAFVNRYGVSVIPLKYVKDGDMKSGKIPAISEWSKYCEELPEKEEIDDWEIYGEISGIGICCGLASNLGCVDVDSEDEELNRRLDAIMPANSIKITGNPKKGGKYLFKLREYDSDPVLELTKKSIGAGYAGQAKNFIDIFVTNQQIAVPPTIHSDKDGMKIKYEWGDSRVKDGEFPDVESLPVLDQAMIDSIMCTIDGQLPSVIAQNIPLGAIELNKDDVDGRYNYMKKRIGQLQRERMPVDSAVRLLLKEDAERNGANSVFLDKVKKTNNQVLNAYSWYVEQLVKNNRGKDLTLMEIPRSLGDVDILDTVNYEGWMPPIMPDDSRLIIEPFDTAIIPKVWRDLVLDVSKSMSVPPEACFFILLTQLSSLMGNKKLIAAKINNRGWKEACNIYSVYVSESGTRKTPMLRVLSEPMKRLQKMIDSDYKEKMIEHQKMVEINEPKIKELERRLRAESVDSMDPSANNQAEIDKIQLELAQLRNAVEPPVRKQLVVNSATTEKLHDIMAANETGTMVVYNELTGLLSQFRKKGYENHRELIMNGWDGLDSHVHQTRGGGDSIIEKACLALYGAIQPSMFKDYIDEIYNNKNDDGFWQRPFIIFDDRKNALKAIDIEFNPDKYHDAYEVFYRAYDMEETDNLITANEDVRDELLYFEDRMYNLIHNEASDAIKSFWGKFTGKTVKVAAIMEYLENEGKFIDKISMDSLNKAIYMMERQITHIKNMFPKDTVYGLSEVVDLMRSGVIQSGMTTYALTRNHRKYFGDRVKREQLKLELEKRNIAKFVKRGSSIVVEVSPHVFT